MQNNSIKNESSKGNQLALDFVQFAVESGVLSINSNSSVRYTAPFGGMKQSGYGRELGPKALEAYSEVKMVYYRTDD